MSIEEVPAAVREEIDKLKATLVDHRDSISKLIELANLMSKKMDRMSGGIKELENYRTWIAKWTGCSREAIRAMEDDERAMWAEIRGGMAAYDAEMAKPTG